MVFGVTSQNPLTRSFESLETSCILAPHRTVRIADPGAFFLLAAGSHNPSSSLNQGVGHGLRFILQEVFFDGVRLVASGWD